VPPFTALATLVSRLVTRKVVAQDKRILENQAAQIALFGKPSHPTANADAPTRWLRRTLRPRNPSSTADIGTPAGREEVQYTL
jgi:xanthosine utilization system XapX-like protein